MAAYRARHEGDAVQHQEMLRHNEQVLQVAAALQAGRDPTIHDLGRAERVRAEQGDLGDLLPDGALVPAGKAVEERSIDGNIEDLM
jgi:hypothetical protein